MSRAYEPAGFSHRHRAQMAKRLMMDRKAKQLVPADESGSRWLALVVLAAAAIAALSHWLLS